MVTVSHGKLLLVEDEPTLRTTLSAVLMDAGHEVAAVSSAEDAIKALQERPYDAVITDKNLPGMSGLALMEHVRARQADVRMLLVTGYPSVGAAMVALDSGFLAFLVKPFVRLTEITDEVARVLALSDPWGRHGRTRQLRARLQAEKSAAEVDGVCVICPVELKGLFLARLGTGCRWLGSAHELSTAGDVKCVVATDLATLVVARERDASAALVLAAEASLADLRELIRLGAGLTPGPGELFAAGA